MAPPRASRLAARKSVVPDPALYAAPSDSDTDREDADRTRVAQQTTTTTTTTTKGARAKGNAGKGVAAAGTARRQSLSQQQLPSPQGGDSPRGQQRRRARDDKDDQDGDAAPAPTPSKRKRTTRTSTEGTRSDNNNAQLESAKSGKKRTNPRSTRQRDDHNDEDAETALESGSSQRTNKRQKPSAAPRDQSPAAAEDRAGVPQATQSEHTSSQGVRAGFKPRAVPKRGAKPSSLRLENTVTAEGDSVPFAFATNPPTPHAPSRQNNAAPPSGKQTPRARKKQMQTDHGETDANDSPMSSPRRRARSASAPIHVDETPVQLRNIAFRQGEATPGTAARSARRVSAKGSGRRGSSIGGGFEAVPHPQVPDDRLYRSTDATEPVARRLRSILSWTAQRQRDKVFSSRRASDPIENRARAIVDAFIADICESRIDVSLEHQDDSISRQSAASLPPHPRNESNEARMREIETNYAAIAREQNSRDSVKSTYEAFAKRAEARRSTSLADVVGEAPAIPTDYKAGQITSIDDAIALGRTLLAGVETDKGNAKGKKAAGRKSKVRDEPSALDELSEMLTDVRFDTADFRQRTHRLDQFVRVAASYVATRNAETKQALDARARQGSNSHAAVGTKHLSAAGDDVDMADVRTGLAGAIDAGRTGQAGTLSATTTAGSDPRDLLRAIASGDSKQKRR